MLSQHLPIWSASVSAPVTDIHRAMGTPPLPAAFAHLMDTRNLAADAALVEVLPHLEPFAQAAALEILVKRGEAPFLAQVVGRFGESGEILQQLVLGNVNGLSAGVRLAISSTSFQHRASAIEVIRQSKAARLAYLLPDALRYRCRQTRELAATALHQMTAHLLDRLEGGPPPAEVVELNVSASCLGEALGSAVRCWEAHLQPKVLQAAFWLGDRVEPAIVRKLAEQRTKITHALTDLLEGTSDPRLAGFVLRALAIPELRSAAARSISRAHDTIFLRAVLVESWLLADAEIERGCRWIRDGRWLQEAIETLHGLEPRAVAGAVRFLTSIGGPHDGKVKRLGELAGAGSDDVRRAVLWQLVHDDSKASTELLTVIAARTGSSIATMATRELRRRRGGESGGGTPPEPVTAATPQAATLQLFDRYWQQFDDLSQEEQVTAGAAIRHRIPQIGALLEAKLASTDPLDQARALRIVRRLELAKGMEASIYRLASGPDSVARSLAVSMLVELPGATAERLLRRAVNDPDERVQANAIETLDQLNVEDRVHYTRPKLDSPNSRVRANAIKALLRVELRQAGEALIDMLEAPSPAHRLSALWVIERLRSPAVIHMVRDMTCNDPDQRVRERAKRLCGALAADSVAASQQPSAPADALEVRSVGGSK